jgi:hypothetical protein
LVVYGHRGLRIVADGIETLRCLQMYLQLAFLPVVAGGPDPTLTDLGDASMFRGAFGAAFT